MSKSVHLQVCRRASGALLGISIILSRVARSTWPRSGAIVALISLGCARILLINNTKLCMCEKCVYVSVYLRVAQRRVSGRC